MLPTFPEPQCKLALHGDLPVCPEPLISNLGFLATPEPGTSSELAQEFPKCPLHTKTHRALPLSPRQDEYLQEQLCRIPACQACMGTPRLLDT